MKHQVNWNYLRTQLLGTIGTRQAAKKITTDAFCKNPQIPDQTLLCQLKSVTNNTRSQFLREIKWKPKKLIVQTLFGP